MPSASQPLRVECRVCRTMVSIPGTVGDGRFRCPKCLQVVSCLESAPAPAAQVAAAAPAAEAGQVSALQADVARLREERDALAARLEAATCALRDAGQLIARLADLEQRIGELGQRCVLATLRELDLEKEVRRLRSDRPP